MSENFVIDNSVVMAWCFEDETSQYADAILDRLEVSTAVVPSNWPLEIGNVLLIAERKKRLSQADSIRFIALLSELPIMIEQEPPERMLKEILALAREHQLSSYNASYLDLAMRKGLPIATLDNGLIAAAKRSRVPIAEHNC
ncbi:MAG: type II toxin-antitoxin system VapC family toxin [Deltaproteobacteria bacterium]|nr:type II toxin-antitoxin system VapC family toxin [Deltaproteobacteria bacterium]MBW1947243.1 type II toxin-antitoxin system VapC family toxin [Deltaproteobacteria bacterium]MBW1967516.1 type II toxin-antitoxin system VapC family toxin [Deltaproteobacteria bacterium]MBW2098934.1 type II toxin-antitoxin system VapC family toxin [Deltaproteobacteria bacterium]